MVAARDRSPGGDQRPGHERLTRSSLNNRTSFVEHARSTAGCDVNPPRPGGLAAWPLASSTKPAPQLKRNEIKCLAKVRVANPNLRPGQCDRERPDCSPDQEKVLEKDGGVMITVKEKAIFQTEHSEVSEKERVKNEITSVGVSF